MTVKYGLAFLPLLLASPPLLAETSAPAPASVIFAWPVEGTVLRAFGGSDGEGGTMQGIAVSAKKGEAVRAAADGVVLYAGPFRSYGALLIVSHECGFQTVVAGAARLLVDAGQKLRRGDDVGALAEPAADGAEVYFELRRDGVPVDPAVLMPPQGNAAARSVTCGEVGAVATSAKQHEERLPTESDAPPLRETSAITWTGSWNWPVRGEVRRAFKVDGNDGIDIAVSEGTDVTAVEKGIVIYAGDGLKDFGSTVLIRHEDGLVTVYGNLSEMKVGRGYKAGRGDKIGKSGKTGKAPEPQLHFEVRKNAAPVDPAKYLSTP